MFELPRVIAVESPLLMVIFLGHTPFKAIILLRHSLAPGPVLTVRGALIVRLRLGAASVIVIVAVRGAISPRPLLTDLRMGPGAIEPIKAPWSGELRASALAPMFLLARALVLRIGILTR